MYLHSLRAFSYLVWSDLPLKPDEAARKTYLVPPITFSFQ